MIISRRIVIALLLVSLFSLTGFPVQSRQTGGRYFPQTGHNVIGEFWTFYQSVPDAALVFGAPITEQFEVSDGSGKLLQYFELARFELDPDKPAGQRLKTTALGLLLYKPGLPTVNLTTAGACRVFPNGLGVCYDFLSFFDQHGGVARFGNPVSAFEFQPDGRIVQSFEKALFEFYPEETAGNPVRLADLGRTYFNLSEDISRLNSVAPFGSIPQSIQSVLSLRVSVFALRAVTMPTDIQQVYVIVQDQAFKPVAGATGTVTIHLPSGDELNYPVTTNSDGIAIVSDIEFFNQPSGSLVPLDVRISFAGLVATTTTSFRIWH